MTVLPPSKDNGGGAPGLFPGLTVLSVEQATALPFMTLRLAQDGMRVIRVENPPRGDPNRWIGPEVLPGAAPGDTEEAMNAYFLPNNLGKESITLNLATATGRELLHRLMRELPVDIFATNQRGRSYHKLGMDYDTLRQLKPDLIWVGITGFGPDHDEAAYDPILQAKAGWMDLTGEADGPPLVFGLPMVDLGSGEHAYGQVMKALYRRAATGTGSRIDVSMYRSAVSWMVSPILLRHSFSLPVKRRGNTHQFFAPVSVFPTADDWVYLSVGNEGQWQALVGLPRFRSLARGAYETNAGRIAAKEQLNAEIAAITRGVGTEALAAELRGIGVPVSPVRRLAEVPEDPQVAGGMIRSQDPRTGVEIAVPGPPVATDHLLSTGMTMTFPPRLGEHNQAILGGLGRDVADLAAAGVI